MPGLRFWPAHVRGGAQGSRRARLWFAGRVGACRQRARDRLLPQAWRPGRAPRARDLRRAGAGTHRLWLWLKVRLRVEKIDPNANARFEPALDFTEARQA